MTSAEGSLGRFVIQRTARVAVVCAMLSYSVVIPAKNASQFLPEALDSVARQRCTPQRVVVVDDGSSDETAGVAGAFGAEVLSWEASRGPAAARNAGVAACTTEIVAFLDADDLWTSDHAERSLAALQRDDVVLSVGKAEMFGSMRGSVPMKFSADEPIDFRETLIFENPVIQSGVMVRKTAFESAGGYDESLRYSEDYDLWYRMASQGLVAPIAECTTRRRVHPHQATSTNRYDMIRSSWVVRRRICAHHFDGTLATKRRELIGLLCEAGRRDVEWAVWTGESAALELVRTELATTDRVLGLEGVLVEVGGSGRRLVQLRQDLRCRARGVRAVLRRGREIFRP